ncbi:MAG: type III secretion system inner membrane ring lipoprotein SctJ [Plesiomonas sp.]
MKPESCYTAKAILRWVSIIIIGLLLTACKIDLYSSLSENDANQMLAILMLHNIDAEKQKNTAGLIDLKVEKDKFINAVETLRLYGFPRQSFTDIETLFPSNQLVTSPQQEQAKLTYLKEQQLAKMLSHIDGVIQSDVTISTAPTADNSDNSGQPNGVAIFIKHSPEVNLNNIQIQIRNLVHETIPQVDYNAISILLQPASIRFQSTSPDISEITETEHADIGPSMIKSISQNVLEKIDSLNNKLHISTPKITIAFLLLVILFFFTRGLLRREKNHRVKK